MKLLEYPIFDHISFREKFYRGALLAYPTEAVFGIGCDPNNHDAVSSICNLKGRSVENGVIVIASSFEQIVNYLDLSKISSRILSNVRATWPGHNTWLLPANETVPEWIRGRHEKIAIRVTAHIPAADLCEIVNGPIVSTSANPHGLPPAKSVDKIAKYFASKIDICVNAPTGQQLCPSRIYDALTGEVVRI
jgi:L-threonylcarbamoyladenylate synthase